jgi:hypothetical protein
MGPFVVWRELIELRMEGACGSSFGLLNMKLATWKPAFPFIWVI